MDDLPEKLRALYAAYGMNYVQAAADTIESLRQQLAERQRERDELVEFVNEVRRTGDTRLASMAIATLAKTRR